MVGPAENLVAARRYIKAIESGARGDELAQFFAPEAVVEISSQPLLSQRQTRQKYEIKNELSSGDTVALEIFWTRTLAVPFQSRPAGAEMRAHFAAFLQFKDGKIFEQRNYDCYDP